MPGDIFGHYDWMGVGRKILLASLFWYVEAGDAVNIPEFTGQPPTAKNDSVQNANSAEIEIETLVCRGNIGRKYIPIITLYLLFLTINSMHFCKI